MSENPVVMRDETHSIITHTCRTCLKTYTSRVESDYYLKLATDCCKIRTVITRTRKHEPFDGPCFDESGNFYSDPEDAKSEGALWVQEATYVPYRIDFYSVIESLLEDHHEDASESDLQDLDLLKKAIELFNENQKSGSYYEGKKSMKIPQNRTFAMIKPCAVAAGKTDEIVTLIEAEGYVIEGRTTAVLAREDAEHLYDEHREKSHFNDLVDFTISGPAELLVLKGGDETPEDFRAFAVDKLRPQFTETQRRNGIHASDSSEAAMRELDHFLPYFA